MYGSVAGVSVVALPGVLAFTGVARGAVLATATIACALLVLGIVLLRVSRHSLFR